MCSLCKPITLVYKKLKQAFTKYCNGESVFYRMKVEITNIYIFINAAGQKTDIPNNPETGTTSKIAAKTYLSDKVTAWLHPET